MINYKLHNSSWYSTRVCPTSVVLFEHQQELFTILIQNNDSHRWWIFPNGKIENTDQDNQAWAAREFEEETWIPKSLLEHIWPLWTLHRTSGTRPKYDAERFRLDHRPEWKKYFYLKQQLYECFVIRNTSIEDLENIIRNSENVIDSKEVSILPISQAYNIVGLGSDRTVLNYIAQDSENIISYLNTSNLLDINAIQKQLLLHNDEVFDK